MMREVVTSGSAVALKGLAGAPLHGKTGTAEFDEADPTKTHAWFIGFKGDIAFAVFVENGGGGAATAVPIAGKFLQAAGGVEMLFRVVGRVAGKVAEQSWTEIPAVRIVGAVLGVLLLIAAIRAMFRK